MWLPWSLGAVTASGHHGWSPSTLVQVSNGLPSTSNGKIQSPQPVGEEYVGGSVVADQTARNPVRANCVYPSDTNLILSVFVLEIMVHGSDVCPQCLEMKLSSLSSTQSYLHVLSSAISKCRKVIFILCPSSTVSVQVYTNTNN